MAVGYSEAQIARLEEGQRQPNITAVQTQFLAALNVRREPALAARLLELARATREVPTPVPHSSPHTNLPRQITRFIRREREVAEVRRLVGMRPLVTLTGSGGAGKTRLAQEAAAMVLGDFAGGVWLAEMASLSDEALVPRVVADVFGLPDVAGVTPVHALIHHLRDKRTLLVLDNCEHVIRICAELSETLLHACSGLTVLATSREPLRIPGELTWRVPSLTTPAPALSPSPVEALGYEAVQLFVEHATSTRQDFILTADNVTAVAQICRRLDGIPLAIELAAARTRTLTVDQIAIGLDDVFHFLIPGSRTRLPRHQTLQALIGWSFHLLNESERILLRRLSVFAGGCTLEAAETVCSGEGVEPSEVLELLNRLHSAAEVIWGKDEPMPAAELEKVRDDIIAIICGSWRYGDVNRFARLRAIMEVGGGFPSPQSLDYATCFSRGIRVLSCAPAFGPAVAEMGLALALACGRQIAWTDRAFRLGDPNWSHTAFETEIGTPFTLYGKQVGFIGFGGLARSLKPLIEPFGCPIQVFDPWLTDNYLRGQKVTPVDLDTLLSTSKIIFVLAVPSASNLTLLDREKLSLIRPDAAFILLSRSHVVDFDALTEMLLAGRFVAGIDVFPQSGSKPRSHPEYRPHRSR